MSLAALFSCTYGSSSLELERYNVRTDSTTRESIGRVGTKVHVEAQCILTAADAATFSAALAAVRADLNVDGRTFAVTGLGEVIEYRMDAALCQYGGPWISYVDSDGPTPFSRKFLLNIDAEVIAGQLAITPLDSFKVAISISPDGLHTVTRSGVINGYHSATYLVSTVLPAMAATYAPPVWVTTFDYESSQDGPQSQTTYRVSARENFAPLPASSNATSVDGTATTRVERDEHYRQISSYDLDLIVKGDAIELLSTIRSQLVGSGTGGAGQRFIFRESYTLTTIHEQRLRGTFVIIESADTDRLLMDVRQSLRLERAEDAYEEKTYVGADPILVLRPARFPRFRQRGSAVAAFAFKRPPDPLYPTLSAPPELSFEDEDDLNKRVEWAYESFDVGDDGSAGSGEIPDLGQITRDQVDENYIWVQEP